MLGKAEINVWEFVVKEDVNVLRTPITKVTTIDVSEIPPYRAVLHMTTTSDIQTFATQAVRPPARIPKEDSLVPKEIP